MHKYFNSGGSFWNCEPSEWAFLCQSRTLCNIQLLLSPSFSLPLLPSPSQNSGKLDLRAASVFLPKAPHRELASSSGHNIYSTFDFFQCLLSAQNMNGLVCWCFCFLHNHHLSLLPWQQRQSGEDLVRGNTLVAILATPGTNTSTCVKTTQLWET